MTDLTKNKFVVLKDCDFTYLDCEEKYSTTIVEGTSYVNKTRYFYTYYVSISIPPPYNDCILNIDASKLFSLIKQYSKIDLVSIVNSSDKSNLLDQTFSKYCKVINKNNNGTDKKQLVPITFMFMICNNNKDDGINNKNNIKSVYFSNTNKLHEIFTGLKIYEDNKSGDYQTGNSEIALWFGLNNDGDGAYNKFFTKYLSSNIRYLYNNTDLLRNNGLYNTAFNVNDMDEWDKDVQISSEQIYTELNKTYNTQIKNIIKKQLDYKFLLLYYLKYMDKHPY